MKKVQNYFNYGIQQLISEQFKRCFQRFSKPMDFIELLEEE